MPHHVVQLGRWQNGKVTRKVRTVNRVVKSATARFLRANFATTTDQTVLMRTVSRVVRNATARFLRANFATTTGQTVLMRTASRVAVHLPTMADDRSLYLLRPLHATTTITANITIISGKRHPWWFLTSPSLLYTTPPDMTDMIRVTVKMEACRPNLLLGQTEAHLCSTLNTKVRRPKMPRLPISLFGPGEILPAENAVTSTERGPPDAATPGANAKVRSVGARSKGW